MTISLTIDIVVVDRAKTINNFHLSWFHNRSRHNALQFSAAFRHFTSAPNARQA